jgi:phage recombination protein Bet
MTKENLPILTFTPEQLKVIREQITPDITAGEFEHFICVASQSGLNPITRQIYALQRNVKIGDGWGKKMSIQTSIDGLRVIAERTGDYGGQDEPLFAMKGNELLSCKITVYRFRNNTRYPAAVGLAFWSEYVQTDKAGKPTQMWAKMPHIMLSKVAEALALRKAYPQDLSGLYTSDEMSQVEILDSKDDAFKDVPNFFRAKTVDASLLNASGLTVAAGEIADEDTKKTREDDNKALSKRLIVKINGVWGSKAEFEGWLEHPATKTAYNRLDKYDKPSFAEVKKAELAKLNEMDQVDEEVKDGR